MDFAGTGRIGYVPLMVRVLLVGSMMLVASTALAQDGGVDAGLDAGAFDGGAATDASAMPDAGGLDAGAEPEDGGLVADDGGAEDGGPIDSGVDDDGGAPDDAGTPDLDAGPSDDGGEVLTDAGPVDCALRCDGDTLRYCDAVTGEPLEIDCAAFDSRCGLLSESWGLDCLLPLDAPCSSGYADGVSRCDPASPSGPLYCNMNTCQTTPGDDVIPQVPSDAQGLGETVEENAHPLACLGCTNENAPLPFSFSVLFIVMGLRQLTPEARRRGRRQRTTR